MLNMANSGGVNMDMDTSWHMVMVMGCGNTFRIHFPMTPLAVLTMYHMTQMSAMRRKSLIVFQRILYHSGENLV